MQDPSFLPSPKATRQPSCLPLSCGPQSSAAPGQGGGSCRRGWGRGMASNSRKRQKHVNRDVLVNYIMERNSPPKEQNNSDYVSSNIISKYFKGIIKRHLTDPRSQWGISIHSYQKPVNEADPKLVRRRKIQPI